MSVDALPPNVKDQLWRYAEQTGQFAKAEDWLFALLADAPGNDDLIRRGIAVYQRLCERSDAELQAGQLPREEVLAGLAELQGMLTNRG